MVGFSLFGIELMNTILNGRHACASIMFTILSLRSATQYGQ